MELRTIAAGEFKAKCLALMDEVRDKRTPVVITKNGKPVAKLVPIIDEEQPDPIFGFMRGKAKIVGDVMAPIYSDAEYDEFYARKAAMYKPIGKTVSK
jgi:prevent-host-death family protein